MKLHVNALVVASLLGAAPVIGWAQNHTTNSNAAATQPTTTNGAAIPTEGPSVIPTMPTTQPVTTNGKPMQIEPAANGTVMPAKPSTNGVQSTPEHIQLNSAQDKISYTIGVDMGKNFKQQGIQINTTTFMRGLEDGLLGNQLLMQESDMQQTLQDFQRKLHAQREKERQMIGEKNKKAGDAFLEKNKQQKSVVTLKSGLQYQIITPGKGSHPSVEDTVTVEYTGRLLDGTVFDSTEKTGKPVSFRVTDVIPGWTEALQLMRPGAHWKVFIPPELAYGEQGIGNLIGPNETLVFDIHLLEVKKS